MMSSPLVPIFLIVLVDLLAYAVILPLLPFYAESFGASPAMVGALLATFAACQMVAGPPLGRWSDRIGRRPVLLVSQVGTLAGFLLLGAAHSLPLVFAARILDGLTAGNLTVAQAYVADVTAPEDRTGAFGLIGVAYGLSFLLGPALSGALVPFGAAYPIGAAASLSAISLVATWFLLPEAPAAARTPEARDMGWQAYVAPLSDPPSRARLFQFFVSQLLIGLFFGGFALFAERRLATSAGPFGARQVGFTFAYLGVVGIAFQGALGTVARRLGEGRLVTAGFALAGTSLALLAIGPRMPLLLVAMTLFALGTAVLRPSLASAIAQRTARTHQGVALGLMTSLQSGAQMVAPVAAGLLIGQQRLELWALTGAVTGAVGVLASVATPTAHAEPEAAAGV